MTCVRVPQSLSRPFSSYRVVALLIRQARIYALGLLTVCLLCPAGAAFAVNEAAVPETVGSWQPVIAPHSSIPPRLIAVDKNKQQLFVFDKGQGLDVSQSFICTTGQRPGDKQVQGDLKTPEGVYFVVQHLASGLDYTMYGNEAYTLNYPNPVDRLRRKTGYGIWIHGRGETISPLITQGCVALNNNDLAAIGDLLTPGTPVALTSALNQGQALPPQDAAAVKKLEKRVEAWAKAWEQRSTTMFDFYDKQAYSIANEPFEKFQAQKSRLFKQLPWIKTSVRNVQVLQGPGYWVTWFYQEYEAPNLSTQGVRRLYWLQNDKGQFDIVGMEWAPGLTTGSQLAGAEPATPPIEDDPRSEEQAEPLTLAEASPASLERVPSAPGQGDPLEGTGRGGEAVAPAEPSSAGAQASSSASLLAATVGEAAPQPEAKEEPLAEPKLAMELYQRNLLPAQTGVLPKGGYALAAAAPKTQPAEAPLAAATAAPSEKVMGAPALPAAPVASLQAAVELAALNLPPPLPAQQLSGEAEVVQSVLSIAAQGGAAPDAVATDEPQAAVAPAVSSVVPSAVPPLVASALAVPPADTAALAPGVSGSQVAAEQSIAPQLPATVSVTEVAVVAPPALADPSARDGDAAVSVPPVDATAVTQVPATPSPAALALLPQAAETAPEGQAPSPVAGADPVSASVLGTVEEWRTAWEKGDVDLYMEFYAEKAEQGGRNNSKSIRKHKERLWTKAAPSHVLFADIRVKAEGKTATVDMIQEYTDASGGGDRGIKTLHLERIDDMWFIIKEEWSPVPQ